MQRPTALTIRSQQITHLCPFKGHGVYLALCYKKAQDIAERDFCYGCDHVDSLKERFGLRTFKRRIVLSRCKHCEEAASLHSPTEPFKSHIPCCKGFEVVDDEGTLYVPTKLDCTEWMVVDVATGHRQPLSAFTKDKRYRLPLLGAPGTVPNDAHDDARIEAATFAARKRGFRATARDEDESTTPTTKTSSRRRKKTP